MAHIANVHFELFTSTPRGEGVATTTFHSRFKVLGMNIFLHNHQPLITTGEPGKKTRRKPVFHGNAPEPAGPA